MDDLGTNFNRNSSNLYYNCIGCNNTFYVTPPYNKGDSYQTQLCTTCQNKLIIIDTTSIDDSKRWIDSHKFDIGEVLDWYKQMKEKLS